MLTTERSTIKQLPDLVTVPGGSVTIIWQWTQGQKYDLCHHDRTGKRRFLGVLYRSEDGWVAEHVDRCPHGSRDDIRTVLDGVFEDWRDAIAAMVAYEPTQPKFDPQCGQCKWFQLDRADAGFCQKNQEVYDSLKPACPQYAEAVPF
jgi:hypothetical protein